ncbi:MAG: outer membrane lipoprotein-sorting protein [candidate division Zixibacteria bacterium]|nr:outer membrane lipoprotein-sorting protein [candidate division Zixibacteria bacterium]
MKLTIITTSGKERQFTYETWSADSGASSVIKYIAPVRVKGQATLLLNNADDIWFYYPRTDRVRKLATHAKKQKMQGSDFTFEDMGSGNSFVTDFDTEKLADEKIERHECYKIVLQQNREGNSNYARIVMWVIKDNFVPVVIDYYDEDDPEICKKRLIQNEIRIIDGIPTPTKAVMHNNLDDSNTKLEITECKYNVKIDQSRFTQRGFYK